MGNFAGILPGSVPAFQLLLLLYPVVHLPDRLRCLLLYQLPHPSFYLKLTHKSHKNPLPLLAELDPKNQVEEFGCILQRQKPPIAQVRWGVL